MRLVPALVNDSSLATVSRPKRTVIGITPNQERTQSMEIIAATLIGMATAAFAYLTYRLQLGQSFKRLHYSSFMTPLIAPINDDVRHLLTLRCDGEDLINPILCVACVENTGRSPILSSDFSGPLIIRSRDAAIFRAGLLEFQPSYIVDVHSLDGLHIDLVKNGLNIGPMLLNPHDKIKIIYIADIVPEQWELEVVGHIAGIDEIRRIPKPGQGTIHSFFVTPMNLNSGRRTTTTMGSLSFEIMISPVFLDPENSFSNHLKVQVERTVVQDPHIMTVILRNDSSVPFEAEGDNIFTINVGDIIMIPLLAQINNKNLSESVIERYVSMKGAQEISIASPKLGPGQYFTIITVISGKCSNLSFNCSDYTPRDASVIRLETEELIERNLARMEPRLFLSNQKMYQLWRFLIRKYPWLKTCVRASKTSDSRAHTKP
jgi:hypothetical protein